MEVYLHLHHDLGEPKDEYVGPFMSKFSALIHQQTFGPTTAKIIGWEPVMLEQYGKPHPSPCYTPQEHVEYLQGRD